MLIRLPTCIQPLIKKSSRLNASRFQTSGTGPKPGGVSTKEKNNMIYYGLGGALIGALAHKMYRDQFDSFGQRPGLEF